MEKGYFQDHAEAPMSIGKAIGKAMNFVMPGVYRQYKLYQAYEDVRSSREVSSQ